MIRNLVRLGVGGSESRRGDNLCKGPQSGNMAHGDRRAKARGVARWGPNPKFAIRVCPLISHHMELLKHAQYGGSWSWSRRVMVKHLRLIKAQDGSKLVI